MDGGEARQSLHGFAEAGKRKAMMRFTIRLLAAAGLSLLAVGCASKPKTTAVYRGNRAALVNGRAVAPAGVRVSELALDTFAPRRRDPARVDAGSPAPGMPS